MWRKALMNSIEEIKASLADYGTFYQLVRDRNSAYYDKQRKDLKPFIVLGKFIFDQCGNFSKAEFQNDNYEKLSVKVPSVIDYPDIFTEFGVKQVRSSPFGLPKKDERCAVCRKGWTLDDCEDYAAGFHGKCRKIKYTQEIFEDFQMIFKLAGYEHVVFHEIPNCYWPEAYHSEYYCTPWYRVETALGDLRIGWRKRVISIHWRDTTIRRIITKDEVTKDETMVHAWTNAKAVEYLGELRR